MLQLQFAIFFVYMASLIVLGCPLSRAYSVVVIVQSSIFFILFFNFYLQTYIKKPKASEIKGKSEWKRNEY